MTKILKPLAILFAFFLVASCISATDGPTGGVWRDVKIAATPYQIRSDKSADERIIVGNLAFLGGLHLTSRDADFGGYSGIDLSPDGKHFIALSDRSHWLAGDLHYGSNGRLTGAGDARIAAVTDADGDVLVGDAADAESVFGRGLDLFVSFELQNRIDIYRPDENGVIVYHKNVVSFAGAPIPLNRGIEAIAPLRDGRIIAFTENARSPDGGLRGWIVDASGNLDEISYQPADLFLPTDAAKLPGGDIIVVERAFSTTLGPRARLVRLPAEEIYAGAKLEGQELARLKPPFLVDNIEGLAIRETRDGRTFVYLISDDNQNRERQKTIILMFELKPRDE